MEAKFKKVFHSALIIKPPETLWPQIQAIRKEKDKAYERWMPHVNMSFPFVEPETFKEAAEILQKELADFDEFEVELDQFNHFNHGKGSVMWLNPKCEGNQILALEDRIQKAFPFLDDLSKKGEHGFSAHLTCGQFSSNQVEKAKKIYQNNYKPVKFMCEELCLISREGQDAPFQVREVVKLRKKKEIAKEEIPAGEVS